MLYHLSRLSYPSLSLFCCSVLVWLLCWFDKSSKPNFREKRIYLAYRLKSVNYRRQGRYHESGTKAEVLEEYCLSVFCPWLAQPAFAFKPGPLAKGWYCHDGLCPSTSISIQNKQTKKNAPQTFLQANMLEVVEIPPDQMCLSLCRIDKECSIHPYNRVRS